MSAHVFRDEATGGRTVIIKFSDVYEKRVYAVRCPVCSYIAEGETPARAIDALRRHIKLKHHVNVLVE